MAVLPQLIQRKGDRRPARRSLRLSLLGWFMGIALIPLLISGGIGYTKARQGLTDEIGNTLGESAAGAAANVEDFFARAMRELDRQSGLAANQRLLATLAAELDRGGREAGAETQYGDWPQLSGRDGEELDRFRSTSPWYDIKILAADGRLVYSSRRESHFGANLLSGPAADGRLANAVRDARDGRRMVLSPFGFYEPSGGLVSAFLAVPLAARGVAADGIMVFQIDGRGLNEAIRPVEGHGIPADVFLVDDGLRLLTPLTGVPTLMPVRDRVLAEAARSWLDGSRGATPAEAGAPTGTMEAMMLVGEYRGAGGQSVFGHCMGIEVLGRRFGVVVEIPAAQALASLREIRLLLGLVIAGAVLMVIVAGQVISRRVIRPILALGSIMDRVADGHDVRDMEVVGHNEVGDLADKFALMIEHLNEAKRLRDHQFRLQRCQFDLNEQMRGEPDPETLAASILEFVGDLYGAEAGAFYLARPGQRLELAAQFGGGDGDWPVRELRSGQGVVGRAALRHRVEVIRDIPADHLRIQTALGCSGPRTLIVAPFHLAGHVKGVMELATLAVVSDEDLEFLRVSSEAIAVALDSSRSRERVHRLLEETRRQASTLSRQQKELQDKNERLARSDRYKSEFLANMSHELRTPLNSMMLMAQVLGENRSGRLAAPEIDAAATIRHAGEDLLTIIDDILDLSRVEAGKLELHPDETPVDALLEELHQLFQPVADRKGLDLRLHVGPGVPATVLTDGLRLKQVLKNLLNNACKFTERGSVVLRARVPSATEATGLGDRACVAFSVADTGIGMSAEVTAKVFEAFQQGDGTIGRRFGGSGLGLSISRRLAELLHGHLDVSSVEGKGSRFTLFLPVRAAEFVGLTGPVAQFSAAPAPVATAVANIPPPWDDSAETAPPRPTAAPDVAFLRGYDLIVADDEMRTVFQLDAELSDLGLRPRIVRSGPALAGLLAEGAGPTLVLVNPWLDGAGRETRDVDRLLSEMRTACAADDVRFVALVPAGCGDELPAADATVTKPVRISRLVDVCRKLSLPEGVSP